MQAAAAAAAGPAAAGPAAVVAAGVLAPGFPQGQLALQCLQWLSWAASWAGQRQWPLCSCLRTQAPVCVCVCVHMCVRVCGRGGMSMLSLSDSMTYLSANMEHMPCCALVPAPCNNVTMMCYSVCVF